MTAREIVFDYGERVGHLRPEERDPDEERDPVTRLIRRRNGEPTVLAWLWMGWKGWER